MYECAKAMYEYNGSRRLLIVKTTTDDFVYVSSSREVADVKPSSRISTYMLIHIYMDIYTHAYAHTYITLRAVTL